MGKSCHKPTPRKSVFQTEFRKIISAFVLDACHDLRKRKRVKNSRAITGITTGFEELGQLTGGFHRGSLIVIGGSPGMKKSAFAINLALNAATQQFSVAFITADKSTQEISMRMLEAEAREEARHLRKSKLSIDENSKSLPGIHSICLRLKHKHGLDLLAVDDLQSLAECIGIRQSAKGISTIIHALKTVAQELEIAVVVTSHLKHAIDYRADKRPVISDLYAASIIEQKADVILFLYRDEVYYRKPDNEGLAEVIVAKQNYGDSGSVSLIFDAKFNRFKNISDFYAEAL